MRRLVVLTAVLVALTSGVAGATPHVDDVLEHDLITRINRERAARGLKAVRSDPALCDLARYHSADMALGRFVAQVSPGAGSLTDRARAAAGTRDGRVQAHVAAGTEAAGAALAISLLDPALSRVGVGVVSDDDGRLFLTQVAIADRTYTAAPDAELADASPRMEAFLASVRRAVAARPRASVALSR